MTERSTKQLRGVGLVGFGLAGRYFHAPLIEAADMRIVGVVTSRLEEVRTTLPHAHVFSSLDELLSRSDVDLIVIATPNRLHLQQATAALQAGKHVVIDKPMCTSASEARTLIELARRQARVLSVFHNRRWDADFLTIRDLMASGRLTDVRSFHTRWDRFRPQVIDRWRERDEPGAGVLYDLGPHLLDQVLCLFGQPDWVQGDVFQQRDGADTDDGFELLMGKGSLRITVGVNLLSAASAYRYMVNGAQGSYWKRGIDPQETQLRSGMSPKAPEFGRESSTDYGMWIDGASQISETVPSCRGRWIEYYQGIRDALDGPNEPPVSALDGMRVLMMIEAALQSSRTGQRVRL